MSKHELDLQLFTLDFWLNRLMMEKYGTRISAKIVADKVFIFWWNGTCTKGKWIKVGEGKLQAQLIMPSRKQIDKEINKHIRVTVKP